MDTQSAERLLQRIHRIPHKKFVLHGAPRPHRVLLPQKQRYSRLPRRFREKAVYGTAYTPVAVLHALLPIEPRWKYIRGMGIQVFVSGDELSVENYGYIHVCRKEGFRGNALIYSNRARVRAVRILKISPTILRLLHESGHLEFVRR